ACRRRAHAGLRRRDAPGICSGGACGAAARFSRGRSCGPDRQGQCAALEPGNAGSGDRPHDRHDLRAAAARRAVDADRERRSIAMTYENVLVEERGAVTLITLDRPKALNALNSAVLAELIHAFAAYDAD